MRRRLPLTVVLILLAASMLPAGNKEEHRILTTDTLNVQEQTEETQIEPTSVPVALVERIQTVGATTTRITLFDNRVAVVTMREDGKQFFFRKWTLGKTEFEVYLRALKTVMNSAGLHRHNNIDAEDIQARIFLRLPGMEARSFSYSPLQVQDLSTNRLNGILDDIQAKVQDMPPAAEALRRWKPKEGDRIELFSGRTAVVDEVRDNGAIVLQYDDVSILELVPVEARAQVIYRILP